ncbi:MAG: hypothetical protein A2086_11500 [Spirochaetes bacterium GWD1_27_9]|nr:MAG: hypothetical protein A2Z98_14885 [Spirochaetes bacterium GWB1_27_13]OHD24606.1 MAG: hypothetical protein A2Y34_14280 [Spirochaetes bacterium GWC1_27_15]OHD36553.1 MAG: hypothetical protein A2086_11500 [Spirochaetes bacterium GWD1_27_9]
MKKAVLFIFLVALFSCGKSTYETTTTTSITKESKEVVDISKDSQNNEDTDLQPFLKEGNRKFRIAVVESGIYKDYVKILKSMLGGLVTIGWMNEVKLPEENEISALEIIKALKKQNYSDYIEFSEDLFFDFDWDEANAENPKFKKIISEKGGVDLVISLGTSASRVMSSLPETNKIPVIVDSISDPIGAGISKSYEDSGKEFLTVRCDPYMYIRQAKLFYDVVKFKKVGIIYEDTEVGRSYAGLEDIKKVAKEYKFEIIGNTNVMGDPADEKDIPIVEKQYLIAVKEICPKVDAIYLAIQAGLTIDNIPKIMEIINQYKIPTFAMDGSDFVKKGALLGESESELILVGIFDAKNIVYIFKGKKPRSLNQLFEAVPHIAINLKAADIIDFDVPIDILASSDEIYTTIE